MVSVPEISYWEEVLEKGVNGGVLNLLLLFSAANFPAGFVEYLLARGSASVNFRSTFPSAYRRGWTALAYAASQGKMEMAIFLLSNGADVLQVLGRRTKYTIPELVDPSHPELARMLAQVEHEERAKRSTAHGLFPLDFSALCLIRGKC